MKEPMFTIVDEQDLIIGALEREVTQFEQLDWSKLLKSYNNLEKLIDANTAEEFGGHFKMVVVDEKFIVPDFMFEVFSDYLKVKDEDKEVQEVLFGIEIIKFYQKVCLERTSLVQFYVRLMGEVNDTMHRMYNELIKEIK